MNHETHPPAASAGAPDRPALLGLAPLMRRHYAGEDLTPLGQVLLERAAANPADAAALMDAAIILQFKGQERIALVLQQQALEMQRHFLLPARCQPARLSVVALMAPGDLMANVPLECLFEDSDMDLHICYPRPGEPLGGELPQHDVLFVALSETDANRPLLRQLCADLVRWPRPVLNRPERVPRVARNRASSLLADAPGVVMPPTLRVPRHDLAVLGQGGAPLAPDIGLPLIVRPVDSHAGHGLCRIDDLAALNGYLDTEPAEEFFVSPFVDYRGSDGLFRKFRVLLIDGRSYACHMGVSSDWMIHYLNAGMAREAAKRAEEERFMATFDTAFAVRHATALRAIHERIDLDYLGIDCAETADGRLLVFEVDPAMIVHALDPADVFPYKQPQMQKVFRAFRDMLIRAAGRS